MSSTEPKAHLADALSVSNHLYDCTHDPCRCPTIHNLLAVFGDDALVAECRVRGLVNEPPPPPVLISTAFDLCITHLAFDHDDGRAWSDCRFRQLFYFENPMDVDTRMWSDEIGTPND